MSEKKPIENNSDVARENWTAFDEAYSNGGHAEFVEEADKRDRYYVGDQWDDDALAALGDRPALTINLALKTINAIKGHYCNTRADIVYKAGKDTTDTQAMLMTRTADNILQNNKYGFIEGDMFDDGLVSDRGYLDVRMDYETNMLGDIRIRSRDPRTVLLSPQASEYDPSEWPEVIVTEWWSPDDVEALYGKEKADQIRGYVGANQFYGTNSIRFGGKVSGEDGASAIDPNQIRSVRIIDRQYRKLGKIREFVDLETGDTSRIPDDWSKERVDHVATLGQLGVRTRMAKRIRWTVSCDNVLLFDDWSPYDEFTIIPFFPYFRRGKPAGVMKMLMSPQDQLNKTESQMLHIVNTTANSGWVVEAGSLVNMTPDELEDRGAESGLVLVHARNRQPPQKITPNQIPTGLDRIAQKSSIYISDIPGVTPLVGQQMKTDIAGVAMERAQTVALAGLQPVFDNLNRTRNMLATKLVKLIQHNYTEPRILAATDWRASTQETVQFSINTDMLDNITLGKYDIVVSSAPQRDTWADTQFAQSLQLREAGVPIPGSFIVQQSQLANKHEIAATLQQLEGLAPPSPEEQRMQALSMQVQEQTLMLTVEQLSAEIAKTRADTMLSIAKAQATGANVSQQEREAADKRILALESQRNDLLKQAANLQNKKELAAMHVDAKLQTTRYTSLMKSMDNRVKNVPTEGK